MDNLEIVSRIVKHSEKVLNYVNGMDFDEFVSNGLVQEACVFNVAQIGELTNMLEQSFIEKHKEIPWHAMKGLRNRIVHDYDGVNLQIVWDTISKDFPNMIVLLKNVK